MVQNANIGESLIGPNVSIEDGVSIGDHCRVRDSMLLRNAEVLDGAVIEGSIIGPGTRVTENEKVIGKILALENGKMNI